jgi:hypothetical protein
MLDCRHAHPRCRRGASPSSPVWKVELRQLDESYFEPARRAFSDEESTRFTHTHVKFTAEEIPHWLKTRPERHDRANWAIVRSADGEYLGGSC